MPGQPSVRHQRRVHSRLGHLQRASASLCEFSQLTVTARIPLPLHLPMAQDAPSVSARQPRLGVPEVRSVEEVREMVFTHTAFMGEKAKGPWRIVLFRHG
jgi:hypothetical protein